MEREHTPGWVERVHMPVNWICNLKKGEGHCDADFNDEMKFEEHVKSNHPSYAEGSRLAAVKEWCEDRQTRRQHTCPICNCIPDRLALIASQSNESRPRKLLPRERSEAQEELLRHTAIHLKKIGFLSLAYLYDEDEEVSLASTDASGGGDDSSRRPGTWIDDDSKSTSSLASGYREDEFPPEPEQLQTDLDWDDILDPEPHLDASELLNQITQNFVMSKLDNKRFLPAKCFSSIFSKRNVRAVLPGASQNLRWFVSHTAIRAFATVIKASRKSMKELVAIMELFRETGLDDTRLADGYEPECAFAGDIQCVHDDSFNALHHPELWDMAAVQDFFDYRWSFLAPVFSASELGHDLAPSAILPFVSVESDRSEDSVGGFSRVQKARIHPHHHDIPSEV